MGKDNKERDVIIPATQLASMQTSRIGNNFDEPVFKSRGGGTAICDRSIRQGILLMRYP
ncbi:MAG: hypothetical protein RMY34_25935 [Aulosira sp. DedQUE10]|nr:hypothetical protein [Aulosira sp. DedQUE10]